MHLYDLLENLEIDPDNEFRNIVYMLNEEDIWDLGYRSTLIEVINTFFRDLNIRQSFLDFEDFIEALELDSPKNHIEYSIDEFILFAEVVMTIFIQAEEKLSSKRNAFKRGHEIINSIMYVVDKINYSLYEKDKYIFISPKNKEAEEAVNAVDDKEISIEILHYHHISLSGNLSGKRKILVHLATYIEPLLNSKILSSNGYKQLETDVGFYLNNLNIRHNNLEGAKLQQICVDIHKKGTLEEWYDKTYNTILMCIIADKQIGYRDELKALKSSYGM